MKKLIEFVKVNKRLLLFSLAALLMIIAFITGARALGSAINEHRINKLETEKQQALKRAEAAHDQNLVLQGQVKAKDEQINSLTSQLADSNERVTNAHNESQSARATVNQVRRDPPKFNAADDAGRVQELGTDLQRLYRDTP